MKENNKKPWLASLFTTVDSELNMKQKAHFFTLGFKAENCPEKLNKQESILSAVTIQKLIDYSECNEEMERLEFILKNMILKSI